MESIRTIHESVELEVQLISDLLDLTKVARGKFPASLSRKSELTSYWDELYRSYRTTSHRKIYHFASEDRIIADPARLLQVFWNIIKNAIKFTPDGGSITVRTSNFEFEGNVGEESSPTKTSRYFTNSSCTVDSTSTKEIRTQQEEDCHSVRKGGDKKVMLLIEVQDTGMDCRQYYSAPVSRFRAGRCLHNSSIWRSRLGFAITRSLVELHRGTICRESALRREIIQRNTLQYRCIYCR